MATGASRRDGNAASPSRVMRNTRPLPRFAPIALIVDVRGRMSRPSGASATSQESSGWVTPAFNRLDDSEDAGYQVPARGGGICPSRVQTMGSARLWTVLGGLLKISAAKLTHYP